MTKPIEKVGDQGTEDAIKAALAESQYEPGDDLESQLAGFDEELGAEDEEGEPDSTVEPSTAKDSSQASAPAEGEPPFTAEELATAEKTDSYWGTDLTGIPVEKKAALIRHLSQQDSTIRKLQERLSTPVAPETPPVLEEETPPTDEELLRVAGIDPEDYNVPDAIKASTVALMRNQLALEDQVERLSQVETGRAVEGQWNKDLDELEKTYGALPGTRADVLRYAMEESVPTPADLYFRLTAPVKREVDSLAAAARREAEKKVQSAGVKPRSTATGPSPIKKGMSMRDAVKQAAMEAQKETGLSWKQAVRRVIRPGAE